MKQHITIKKDETGYIIKKFCHDTLDLIYFFLCGDASIDFEGTIEVFYRGDLTGFQSNFTYFEKIGSGEIILGTIHEDEMPMGIIKCTDKQLEKLIRDWQHILVEQPQYVTITQAENGNFIVTGSDAIS